MLGFWAVLGAQTLPTYAPKTNSLDPGDRPETRIGDPLCDKQTFFENPILLYLRARTLEVKTKMSVALARKAAPMAQVSGAEGASDTAFGPLICATYIVV